MFNKEYWNSSASKLKSVKYLALMGVFIALKIVASKLYFPVSENLKVGFGFVLLAIESSILGPVAGALSAIITDNLGFFLGGGLGWNTTVHTWRPTGQGFSLLKNGLLFAGYKVNDYHGIRLSGEYLTDKVWQDYGSGPLVEQKFNNTLLSLDYQFNIFNALAGVRPGRRWDASLYLGPSLALGDKGSELAWNFGGILSYAVSRNLSLFYSHTIYRMSKDRYESPQVYRTPGTIVNSLNVGMMYNLNRPAFGKDGVLVTDYAHQPLFFEYSIGPFLLTLVP